MTSWQLESYPVTAYIRDAKSANARRIQKSRAKAAAAGVKQVNLMAPQSGHEILKQLAKQLAVRETTMDALRAVMMSHSRLSRPAIFEAKYAAKHSAASMTARAVTPAFVMPTQRAAKPPVPEQAPSVKFAKRGRVSRSRVAIVAWWRRTLMRISWLLRLSR